MEIKRIAIIGAGSIGTAWAIAFASAGLSVTLCDPDKQRLVKSKSEFASRLDDLATFSLLQEAPGQIGVRIRIEADCSRALADADYVQECAPETLTLKRGIFASLHKETRPDAILASSSSFIPISDIADQIESRSRCLVVHPGNPPYLLRVAEIVPAEFTDPKVVEDVERLMIRVGIAPVTLSREIEGFVFNRLQGALLREAYCLIRDGIASPNEIDQIVKHGLGLRWSVVGPFETAHLNTRGGIEAHAERMGPSYARMGRERGQDDPWTPEMIRAASRDLEKRSPLSDWEQSVERRDRSLMALYRERIALGLTPRSATSPLGKQVS